MSITWVKKSAGRTGIIEQRKSAELKLSGACHRNAHIKCKGRGRLNHGIKFECQCVCHQPGWRPIKGQPRGEKHWNYGGKSKGGRRKGVSQR